MAGNYNKKLVSTCDDMMFASGEIIVSWKSEDQDKENSLRTCKIYLDLQYGSTAILRVEEIDALIKNLETVRDRLQP